MNSQNRTKLNQLLKDLPPGSVATQLWLQKHAIYRQLADVYCKSGWLRKIGRGAYIRKDDHVSWTGGLYAIQSQLNLPIHVGGMTALEHQGLIHFLPLGKARVFLFGNPKTKLPKWFRDYDWKANIHFVASKLFRQNSDAGLTKNKVGTFDLTFSSPERAMIEMLSFVPKQEPFEHAALLMENLTTLRPQLVQELLNQCASVKIVRVFMFLVEEYQHQWVNELNTGQMNIGKGKRVIVSGGRLDPIYHITVPRKPFVGPKRQIQELQNKRNKSPAIRLMLPEKLKQLSYGKDRGSYASILHLAFERGYLPLLDQLLKRFQIETRGSDKFKGKLQETWLELVPNREHKDIKKGSNNTLAALIELVVAEHLKKNGCRILDLEAWNQSSPDIRYQDKNRKWNAEVKYIPQSPEWREMTNEQLKTGKMAARWFGDGEFVNYYFGRIAEATKQLEPYPYETRQVWLIFSTQAAYERKMFEKNYLSNPPDWFRNTEEQNNILKMISEDKKVKEDISKKSPKEWLQKVSEVILATFDSWSLTDINQHKTTELVRDR